MSLSLLIDRQLSTPCACEPSTTLSDPWRNLEQLEHALKVVGPRGEETGRQDFLEDGPHARQGQGPRGLPLPFDLEEGVGERGEDGMALPARQRAAFKVVLAHKPKGAMIEHHASTESHVERTDRRTCGGG